MSNIANSRTKKLFFPLVWDLQVTFLTFKKVQVKVRFFPLTELFFQSLSWGDISLNWYTLKGGIRMFWCLFPQRGSQQDLLSQTPIRTELKVNHFNLFRNCFEIGQWTQNLQGGREREREVCLTHRHTDTHSKYVLFPHNTTVKFYVIIDKV